MRTRDRRVDLVALVISAGCVATGCAPVNMVETADPSASGASGFLTQDDGKTDSTYDGQAAMVTAMFDGRATLWANGFVQADFGQQASGSLTTSLPDSGVDLQAGLAAFDAPGSRNDPTSKDLGIPAGFSTEIAVFNLYRGADQSGHLFVDHDPHQVAVRIATRYRTETTVFGQPAEVTTTEAHWVEGSNIAYDGSPLQGTDVMYSVIIAPGGVAAGNDTHTFDNVRFRLDDSP